MMVDQLLRSTSAALIIAFASLSAAVTTASADEGEVAQATLDVSAMDFSTPEGLEAAMVSIDEVVLQVCTEAKPNSAYDRTFLSECQREKTNDIVLQIADERLTEYHEDRKTPDIVEKVGDFVDGLVGDD